PAAGGHPGGGPGPARGRGGGARAPWSSVERGGAAPLSVTDSDFRYRSPVVGGSIAIARRSDLLTAKKNFTVLREPCGALGRGARGPPAPPAPSWRRPPPRGAARPLVAPPAPSWRRPPPRGAARPPRPSVAGAWWGGGTALVSRLAMPPPDAVA